MRTADKSLGKEHARYKLNFDARLRKPKYEIPAGSYVFLLMEQSTAIEPKRRLAYVATSPYAVKTQMETRLSSPSAIWRNAYREIE